MNTPAYGNNYSFELIPNGKIHGKKRVFQFYFMVIIPLLMMAYILYNHLNLRGTGMVIGIGTVLLILVNVFFYYFRRSANYQPLDLRINSGEIQLLNGNTLIYSSPLEDIESGRLNWGFKDERPLPVIQLRGRSFPTISISSLEDSGYREKGKTCTDYSDYFVTSEKEWQHLIELFNHRQASSVPTN